MAYIQVTLEEFRTDLLASVEGVPYWTLTEATNAINEALRVWNLMTGQWKGAVPLTTVANQHWYSTPSTLLYPIRINWKSFPLEPGSLFDLDYGKINWEGQTIASTDCPPRPLIWAPSGINRFCIWPADTSVNDMVVEGVAKAPQFLTSSTSTFVDIQQEDQGAILDYALYYLAFKEGGPRFEGTYRRFQNFVKQAAARNSKLKASTFYRNMFQGIDLSRNQRPTRAPKIQDPNGP